MASLASQYRYDTGGARKGRDGKSTTYMHGFMVENTSTQVRDERIRRVSVEWHHLNYPHHYAIWGEDIDGWYMHKT